MDEQQQLLSMPRLRVVHVDAIHMSVSKSNGCILVES